MKKHPAEELPIRSKVEMVKDISTILHNLNAGEKASVELLIQDLKARSLFLDEQIQQDVLIFSEIVEFQLAYDPAHPVSFEVQKAADKLVEDLGFQPPPSPL